MILDKIIETVKVSNSRWGASRIARDLTLKGLPTHASEVRKWKQRGWIGEKYARPLSELYGVSEQGILDEAKRGDQRRKHA